MSFFIPYVKWMRKTNKKCSVTLTWVFNDINIVLLNGGAHINKKRLSYFLALVPSYLQKKIFLSKINFKNDNLSPTINLPLIVVNLTNFNHIKEI